MLRRTLIVHKIRWCLAFFNFLGFGNNYSYDSVVHYLLLFLLLFIIFLDGFIRLYEITLKVGTTHFFNIIIRWFFLLGSSVKGFTSVSQAFLKVQMLRKFLNKMSEADELIRRTKTTKINYQSIQWRLTISIMCSTIFYFSCFCYNSYNVFVKNGIALRIVIPYYLPIIMMQIYIQKYIFAIQLLQCYIQLLNNALINIKNHQFLLLSRGLIAGWRMKARQNHLKVAVAGKIYELLWESSKLINESFNETLLVQLSMSFITLLNFGYGIITALEHGSISTVMRHFVSIFMNFVSLFLCHLHAQQCYNDVSNNS